jgi:hypothetical protein
MFLMYSGFGCKPIPALSPYQKRYTNTVIHNTKRAAAHTKSPRKGRIWPDLAGDKRDCGGISFYKT